ncbi:MAG: triose-phosphate isomerase [Lysobacterales bacterium]
MNKRKRLVLGNWKMNGSRRDARDWASAAARIAADHPLIDVGIMPATVHLQEAQQARGDSRLWLGAQNLAAYDNGAYTGEVSAQMLLEFGVCAVLCGHSERRQLLGDNDSVVKAKLQRALAAGITPVLCLGETLEQRESGATESVVLGQLDSALSQLGATELERIVIAYEPVWAIGTGLTASPAQAQAVHALIRSAIAQRDAILASLIRILYGGSVKGSNAAELFAQADVDGGLIGGASLVPSEFAAICRAASQDG